MIDWIYKGGLIAAFQFALFMSIGVITSYTDLKFGKIRNHHVFFLASVGAALTLYQSFSQDMVMWWCSSAFMSISIPLLLWWRSLIPAGDAKLLMAMGLAVPSWWYPSFAPRIFPFSVVLVIAFLMLAAPVVWSALFRDAQGISPKGVPIAVDRFGRRVYAEHLLKSIRRWIGDGGMVSAILLPALGFIFAWMIWVDAGRLGLDAGYFLALGVAITFISFFLQEFCVRLKLPLFVSIPSLIIFGVVDVWFGVSLMVLVFTAAGAFTLVVLTGFARERVGLATMDVIGAQDVSPGSVIEGVGPEGISEGSAQDIRVSGKPVAVFQEVRFAHALFLALLISGGVRIIESYGLIEPIFSVMVSVWR